MRFLPVPHFPYCVFPPMRFDCMITLYRDGHGARARRVSYFSPGGEFSAACGAPGGGGRSAVKLSGESTPMPMSDAIPPVRKIESLSVKWACQDCRHLCL